jgi:uncharacterized membrane protein required for colicin V production
VSITVAADAVVLFGMVIAVWSGWRTGAARMIVSTLAAIAGIFLAAQGRGPLASVVSQVLPDADEVLVSLLILVGASWIFLGLLSWVLGNLLRGVLRTIQLGLLDDALGAALGLLQGSQAAGLLRETIYPLLWSLLGAGLPSELQQILRP